MNCIYCKKEIPKERLEILPETETCVSCSRTPKYLSIISGTPSGKQSILSILNGDNKLALTFINKRKMRVIK